MIPFESERRFGSRNEQINSRAQKASQRPRYKKAFDEVGYERRCADRECYREEVEASPHKRSFAVVSVKVPGDPTEGKRTDEGEA